jgi:hypothetical protein
MRIPDTCSFRPSDSRISLQLRDDDNTVLSLAESLMYCLCAFFNWAGRFITATECSIL